MASLLVPCNDLESLTMIEIASAYAIPLCVSPQQWGARLGIELERKAHTYEQEMWISEMADPDAESALCQLGKSVKIIDHHEYWLKDGSYLDRRNPLSSLEQLAILLGHKLNAWQQAVALNDRGYIWAMAAAALPYDLMLKVRQAERMALRISNDAFTTHEEHFVEKQNTRILVGTGRQAALVDQHFLPSKADWAHHHGCAMSLCENRGVLCVFARGKEGKSIQSVNAYGCGEIPSLVVSALDHCTERWSGGCGDSWFVGGVLSNGLQNLEDLNHLIEADNDKK
jgi:hypothetical protein